ncbi:MAG TPA: ORF6N domain-containing protein [Candidatus Paceibacterota bacterium]
MKSNAKTIVFIPEERVAQAILVVRGQKVMLDSDLAKLYGVLTKNLNKAVSRNKERFPEDFMFHLNKRETENLRFHFGTSSLRHGGSRYLPYVFTEHGALMLASVLKSPRAIEVSLIVVRAFVRMREMLSSNVKLASKLDELESKISDHDTNIRYLMIAIRRLMSIPEPKRNPIGFGVSRKEKGKN